MLKGYVPRALCKAALFFGCTVIGWAQMSQITGRVEDKSGAVVPDAQLTATNTRTGIARVATTNSEGYYTLALLPPGDYEIAVKAKGLSDIQQTGIKLDVSSALRLDFSMDVATLAESIQVVGGAPLVAQEEASLGTIVDERKLLELPLNGRDPLSLISLAPGVTPNPRGATASNINGSRDNVSDVLIDGGSATSTDQADAYWKPPLEGVAEFRVETASFSAEYGRGGGVVNVLTKGGGNKIHGSLFEFVRNDAFDANNFFFNATNQGKGPLRYNQFGGSIGGPVVLPKLYDGRNRTFFFFTPEFTRSSGAGLNQTVLPTERERAGDFSLSGAGGTPVTIYDPATTTATATGYTRTPFANSRIPESRMDPLAVQMLKAAYPLPNNPGQTFNYISSGATTSTTNAYLARVDHNFTPDHRLTVRYFWNRSESQNPKPWPGFPGELGFGTFSAVNGNRDHVVLRETANIRPNLLNEFTYAFTYSKTNLLPNSGNQGWAQTLGIKNAAPYLFPDVLPAGYTGVYGGNLSTEGDANHHFGDQVTWIKGGHMIKAGFDYRTMYYYSFQPLNTAGAFNFDTQPTRNPSLSGAAAGGNSLASLLLGIPSNTSLTVNNQKLGRTWRYHSAFLQDKWNVTPKLTINYGVRWEYTRPVSERWNRFSVFDLSTLQLRFMGENGEPTTLFDGDFNNFAPRIGLAYSPFANRKTSLRAAFGLYYLPINTMGAVGYSKGFTASRSWQTLDGGITFPLTLADAFPVVPISRDVNRLDNVNTIGPSYATPMVSEWTFSIQQETGRNTLLEANYVGSKGTHLQIPTHQLNQVPTNLLGPGDAQSRRPYPQLGSVGYAYQPIGNSSYHSLQLKFERRMTAGLNLLGWYSLQKSIDDASGFFSFRTVGYVGIQDHYNLRAERSISTFDRTHNAVVSAVYELPFGKGKRFSTSNRPLAAVIGGWQLNGIFSVRSGTPLTMTTAQNLTGSLNGGSRPNRLRSGVLTDSEPTIQRWFDVSAFQSPNSYQFGNTSRSEPDLRGPGTTNLDFSIFRNLKIGEQVTLQIRAEAFNALNKANFGMPSTSIGASTAGIITSADSARNIQFGARLAF